MTRRAIGLILVGLLLAVRGEDAGLVERDVVERNEGVSLWDSFIAHKEQQAILIHDVIFQNEGKLYPHYNTLLVKSSLSYSILEDVPRQTRRIALTLKQLADNLTHIQPPPKIQTVKIPDYYAPEKGSVIINIREARQLCKEMNMRLLAPRSVTELNAAGSFYTKTYNATPYTQIWIDTDFDLASSQLINPINKRTLGQIYEGNLDSEVWKGLRDDHSTLIAYNPVKGDLVFLKIENLGGQVNTNQWTNVLKEKEPEARVMCQGFGLEDQQSSFNGMEVAQVKMLNARANSILPREEIRATERIFTATAISQQNRINRIITQYNLNQPLFEVTPEKEWRQSPKPQMPEMELVPPDQLFQITSYEHDLADEPTAGVTRNKRDVISEELMWNMGKSLPLIGPYIGTVHDILRQKELNAFRDDTGASIRQLYSAVSSQARKITEIKFGENEMRVQIRTIQNEVDWLYSVMSDVKLYLEMNAVIDRLRTKMLITHAEYLIQTEKFERWISQMKEGINPEDLYKGNVLKDLRNVLAGKGLTVKAAFQDTESMIIPDINKTQSVVILSSIRASGPPWTIFSVRSLPRYYKRRLFREKVESPFIAVNQRYTQYISLTEQQARQCKNELCEIRGPIRSLSNAGCGTIALMGDPSSIDCPVQDLVAGPHGYFESVEGGMLYSVEEETQVTITCPLETGTMPRYEYITGRGILLIRPGCQGSLGDGDNFLGMPASDYIGDFNQNTVNTLFTIASGLGRLQKSVESKIQMVEVATKLTQKVPQIALFAAMGAAILTIMTLACCVLKLRHRSSQIKNLFGIGKNGGQREDEQRVGIIGTIYRQLRWCRRRKHDKLPETSLTVTPAQDSATPGQNLNSHARPKEKVDEGISLIVHKTNDSEDNTSAANFIAANPPLTSSPWEAFTENHDTQDSESIQMTQQRESVPPPRGYRRQKEKNTSDRVSLTRDMLYPA